MCNYRKINLIVEKVNLTRILPWNALLLLLVVSQTSAENILIDDFNDRDDVGWRHLDLIADAPNGPAIFDASSGAYHIGSTGFIPDVEDPNIPNTIGAIWDASSDPIFSNGLARTTFRITDGGTAFGLVMRLSGLDSPNFDDVAYYLFGATAFFGPGQPNDGAVHFNRIKSGTTTKNEVLETRGDLFDRDWIMEAGIVGDKLTMRYWPVGEAEPSQPQWEWVDPNPLDVGTFGLRTNVDRTGIAITGAKGPFRIGATFDDISFMPAPELGLSGDFDRDGDVDSADRTTQTTHWTGALPPGDPGATKTFEQGDHDGDGDVDTADQNGLINNWTGAMNARHFVANGPEADLAYDPANGHVTLDASVTTGQRPISFVLDTDQDKMRTENRVQTDAANAVPILDVGANPDVALFQNGLTDSLSQGTGLANDIVPAGMNLDGLVHNLTLAEYTSGLGDSGTLDLIVIPEPTTITLASIGLALFWRRRGLIRS